jgi:zinc resistance-associated protein
MWNAVLGAAVAVTIAGSSIVYAQQPESEGERRPRPGASQADRPDSTSGQSSNLASLKERLRLTPDQEKNWPAFESAFRALTQSRRSQDAARPVDPVPRMRQRAEALTALGAALSRLADAEAPLYNSLNEDQRRQFATFSSAPGGQGEMQRRSLERELNRDDRGWRDRDERDRRGSRSRDEDDRRRWRDRENDDRFGWRGRDDDRDRRSSRDRDYDEGYRGWRGRDHDDERHSWRGRRDDDDRRGWRDRDERDRRGWRDRDDDEDRRSRRGGDYDDRD